MIEITLIILIIILFILGCVESYYHKLALKALPIRIHVNGSRGKSSVTRLIAAGLRAGRLKTFAKTTGTSPRIIDAEGNDQTIHRLRSASIGEQVRLLRSLARKNLDAIVIECMAVNPQYQWIAEQKMIKSTTSVMTNVRPDHLDEMGHTLYQNTMSLSNTIPYNGTFVTPLPNKMKSKLDFDLDQKIYNVLSDVCNKRSTVIESISADSIPIEFMEKFSYMEHRENVAVALKVCEINGIDKQIALNGMLKAKPDPGATVIWKIKCAKNSNFFVNLMAANDPSSTLNAYLQLKGRIKDNKVCIFFNTRSDRRYRTSQLLSLIFNKINPDYLVIRADDLPEEFDQYMDKNKNLLTKIVSYKADINDMVKIFSKFKDCYIVGIGNMVGWGEQFVKDLKKYKI